MCITVHHQVGPLKPLEVRVESWQLLRHTTYEADNIENKILCMYISSVKLVYDFNAVRVEILNVIQYFSWQTYWNIVRHLHYFM
jgi:ABC-type lipoprotein release transport system permease subunit